MSERRERHCQYIAPHPVMQREVRIRRRWTRSDSPRAACGRRRIEAHEWRACACADTDARRREEKSVVERQESARDAHDVERECKQVFGCLRMRSSISVPAAKKHNTQTMDACTPAPHPPQQGGLQRDTAPTPTPTEGEAAMGEQVALLGIHPPSSLCSEETRNTLKP